MRTVSWHLGLLVLAAFAAGAGYGVRSEEGGNAKAEKGDRKDKKASRWTLLTIDEIAAKLAPDVALNAEQKAKIQSLRDELTRKSGELMARPEVKAAKAEVDKAKAAGDKEASKVARTKLTELLGGFNLIEEFKKGLTGTLTAEQIAKLYPPRASEPRASASGGKGEGKKEEKAP